jgi:hypothetical protein
MIVPMRLPPWQKILLLALFAGSVCGFFWWFTRTAPPPPARPPVSTAIDPSGGEFYFKRKELPVTIYRQNDDRWGAQPLGSGQSGDTLGSAGCAVSSTAMVLTYYGIDTDPARLNAFLTQNGGFTAEGWLIWEKAAELAPDKVKFIYEGDPTHQLIDANLKADNPVLVRLRYPSGITHFVVICGKDGHDYLVRDPGRGAAKGIYPLKDFGSKIEALRFYEKR